MEKPNATTVQYYEQALPGDARVQKGQMFGHPCAFVNGNMFFGTFGQSVVARVGETRAAVIAGEGKLRIFTPMDGRAWREYLQIDTGSMPPGDVQGLAHEALENTARLPPKVKKAAKKASR